MHNLQQLKVGDYTIEAEHIHDQQVDGFAAIYDREGRLLFEGEYRRSKKNGFGVEYDEMGNAVFQGNFRDDKYDGWGHTWCYEGEYRGGYYDGYGILFNDEVYYEGFFQKGQYSGEGIRFTGLEVNKAVKEKIKTQNVYDFLSEQIKDNLKRLWESNISEVYLGEWKEGSKHGFGRLWRPKYWYAGQFSNDLHHGLGAEEHSSETQNKVVQTVYRLGNKK